jgi:hypothetical protein
LGDKDARLSLACNEQAAAKVKKGEVGGSTLPAKQINKATPGAYPLTDPARWTNTTITSSRN